MGEKSTIHPYILIYWENDFAMYMIKWEILYDIGYI